MMRESVGSTGSGSHQQTRRLRVARLATEVFAPAPVVAALLVVVAAHSGPTILAGLAWGLLAVLMIIPVPLFYVLRGVRRRRLSDRHVGVRAQRPLPMLIGVGAVVVALVVLSVLGAPRELVALIAAMFVGLLVSLLITLRWKISIHTAVVAGDVVILVLVFGPILLPLLALVALVGWARVTLGDHTSAQVIAGASLGAIVAASVFTLLW
ncbi:MAG TPA: phosphoesterase PA-phosphatase [Chloroflexota bacterium]|nr:phosphoesterase PA-phosphatase [Chloroflexota bacterium]